VTCQSAGARLCDDTELAHDEARGSGCNYDSELVWPSTLCGEGHSFIARMISPGGKQASADSTLCLEEATSNIASMRYADVYACTGHPTGESSHPPRLSPHVGDAVSDAPEP
jgi:hypothetical protein